MFEYDRWPLLILFKDGQTHHLRYLMRLSATCLEKFHLKNLMSVFHDGLHKKTR